MGFDDLYDPVEERGALAPPGRLQLGGHRWHVGRVAADESALNPPHSRWGACGVALTAVMSLVIFGEPVTPLMAIGILLIMGGVLLVELGSQAAQKKANESVEDAR